MRSVPTARLPRPVDPVGRAPFARRRYERRHGFLPFEGREELPATGRTTLHRVEWGRSGRDVCVMLARWEHRLGAWERAEVVDHEWVPDDGAAIGEARHRLGTLGERLEEEADDARLAGALPPLRPDHRPDDPPPPSVSGMDAGSGWMAAITAVLTAIAIYLALAPEPPPGSTAKPPPPDALAYGMVALFASATVAATLGAWREHLDDRAAPNGFMPWERRRRRAPDGRTTLYRVQVVRDGGRSCVLLARWHHRRSRWRRDDVLAHRWVGPAEVAAVRERMEATARALEAADPDDYAEPDRVALRRAAATWQHYEDAPFQAELAALQAELDAIDDLVEDLAEDPR